MSNTRMSVSLVSKHQDVIYQTRWVFHSISKHREVIYQTLEGVFHWYLNTRKWYNRHKKEYYTGIQTLRRNISNTRRSVSLVCKHQEVIYQTRGLFHPISKHWEVNQIRYNKSLLTFALSFSEDYSFTLKRKVETKKNNLRFQKYPDTCGWGLSV